MTDTQATPRPWSIQLRDDGSLWIFQSDTMSTVYDSADTATWPLSKANELLLANLLEFAG